MSTLALRIWASIVFVGTLATYLATYPRHIINADAFSATVESFRIATTGRPWLDGFDWSAVAHLIPGYHLDLSPWVAAGAGGHAVSFRSPGATIVSVPAYWIDAHLLGHHGYHFGPGNVTACVLTALAMTLFFLTVVRRVRLGAALAATLVLAFATPMWSVSAAFLWTHPITVLGIAGMAWAADRDRWWLVGLFGGIGLWGRLHVAVIVAILGLGVAVWRRRPAPAVRTGLVSAAMLALASLYSHWLYGGWNPAGGYGSGPGKALATGNTGDSPVIGHGPVASLMNHLGLWIAPDRGVLLFTPVLLILIPLVVLRWRELPDWSRVLAVAGLVYTLVQGQIDGFTGGSGFFGYRLMLEPLMCAAPACVLAVRRMPRRLHYPVAMVVAAMWGAFTYAALIERSSVGLRDTPSDPVPYLPLQVAWTHNAVIDDLRTQGPDLWLCLLGAVVVCYYVVEQWRKRVEGAAVIEAPVEASVEEAAQAAG
jgi:alpha-1,2-mannosyltransferase